MKVNILLSVLLLFIMGFIETKGQVTIHLILHPIEQTITLEDEIDSLDVNYNPVMANVSKQQLADGLQELKAVYPQINIGDKVDDIEIPPQPIGDHAVILYSIEAK
ncbi:hypothetical protein [Sphingobacterium chuzhouense]|uniref:Uncharacterized protein n=1 Tax=Sphingobacterium chuzhouense TaxID=1742264 RepID=A0ABR7XLR5_9SPHI|nr:hypothetical protein [Sphingobacterium chuzhouense]MBD1420117.1 hypothetical protein [Sphingobacterium chuzhouense]